MMQPLNEDFISTKSYKKNKYKDTRRAVARQFMGIGVIQVIVGVLCIAFNSVDIKARYLIFNFSFFGHGIWSGVMFIVTGCFGIIGGIRKTGCIVVTFQVLSIISSIFGCLLFVFAALSLVATKDRDRYFNYNGDRETAYNTSITMESLILVLAVLEIIISMWASSLVCCHINCCRKCCARCCYNCCYPPDHYMEELMLTWARNNQQQPMITFNAQRQPMTTPNPDELMMIQENPQHPLIMKHSQQILIDADRQAVSYDRQASRSHYTALSSRERKNEGSYSGVYSEIIEGYEIPDLETSSEITHNACLSDYEAMTTGQTGNRSSFRKS